MAPEDARTRRLARSAPPLALLAVCVVVAVLVLPSSLNLPSANPSTVVEYAPVPPSDEDPPPPADGDLASLGLGTSGTVAAPPPPPPAPEGAGARPNQKRCVGDPPRQTEDPSSPPCVPFFEGDNFGETYQGVTGEEVTVLFYFDSVGYGDVTSREGAPVDGTYVDIDAPALPPCAATAVPLNTDPTACDHVLVRALKGFARHFNDRYQTYGRHVHHWAYFTSAETAAQRRADAVGNWERLKPFAAIDAATFNGFNSEYQEAMTQLGVLTFSSAQGSVRNDFYRAIAPLAWGFYPDVEHLAAMYSSYVCQKVAPFPVRRSGAQSGQGAPNGQPRRFGLWYTVDPSQPELTYFADIVKAQLDACGVAWVEEATFSVSGFAFDATESGQDAREAVARFESAGVTTVLYLGGLETRLSTSADAARYYPEIVVAGDLSNDGNTSARDQNQNVWKNAWSTTSHVRVNRLEDSPGFRAFKEGYPGGDADAGDWAARTLYRDAFMLFQAIQVAGPELTPASIDEGFHAIPEQASTNPYVSAFFFDPGDYTSVKDAAEQWWDPTGATIGSPEPGCWRMVREGKRYLAGTWEGGDDVFKSRDDPCTAFPGSASGRLADL